MGHPPSTAETNLLFGILALQNNFIDRNQFLDAFTRWAEDKARPIGQILLDRGALNPNVHDLLAGLVAAHLACHGGDPHKSLAALSSIGSVRDDLSRVPDTDVQASLLQIPVARQGDVDQYGTIAQPSLGASTSAGTRFRILRPHAKGGLGQVSVALDQELDRPVALKEIQDRYADEPGSRSRFMQEAEITGKLEHPGIIPVYGLGQDATGRPFYAMRFIQGDSLKEAIAAFHRDERSKRDLGARAARLRELLRRFTDVCNAVAYAHSRGVLHRDLKPGNIMLGPYGETLLVDWGLAKAFGTTQADPAQGDGSALTEGTIRPSALSGSRAETVAGSIVGTPAFASPEQVSGRLDLMGPASDVYGLGATLYTLLTGKPPVDSNELEEVIRRVQKGEVPPPRSIDPTIPQPLDAICRKAMALNPQDRYPSARTLAQDVTRWLDDEPVSAYPEPVTVRAWRWVRRHRTLVTGLTALVLTALVGLTIGVVLIGRERDKTEDQRQIAVASANQAVHNLRLAQNAADGLLAEVADVDLADIPQMEPVRKRLLEEAMEGYREFLTQKGEDALVRWGAGRSLDRLGEIQALLGEYPTADASYREAIATLKALVESEPANVDFRRDLARAYHGLGVLLKDANRFQNAEESLRKATAMREEIALGPGPSADDLQALADSRYQLGAVLARRGGSKAEDASAYAAALEVQQGLAKRFGERPEFRTKQARYLNNLARLQADTGKPREAEATFRATLKLMEPLLRGPTTLPGARWQYARAANNLGTVLLLDGKWDEASRQMLGATGILQTLGNEFPAVPVYRQELAAAEYNLGLLAYRQADFDKALAYYTKAAVLLEELRTRIPGNPALRQKLALALVAKNEVLANKAPAEAEAALRKALDEESAVLAQFRDVPEYQSNLARGHCQLAGLLLRRNNPRDAAAEAEAALTLHKAVLKSDPGIRSIERYVWSDLGVLADALIACRRFADAEKTIEEFLEATPANEDGALNAAALLVRSAREAARTPDKKALAETFLDRAMKVLADAARSNLIRTPGVLNRPEFAPLRDREEFKRLLVPLAEPARVG
jgi:eukaryotic-like serine/threonine-protein kinase